MHPLTVQDLLAAQQLGVERILLQHIVHGGGEGAVRKEDAAGNLVQPGRAGALKQYPDNIIPHKHFLEAVFCPLQAGFDLFLRFVCKLVVLSVKLYIIKVLAGERAL